MKNPWVKWAILTVVAYTIVHRVGAIRTPVLNGR
jgi:hypothetical protein